MVHFLSLTQRVYTEKKRQELFHDTSICRSAAMKNKVSNQFNRVFSNESISNKELNNSDFGEKEERK